MKLSSVLALSLLLACSASQAQQPPLPKITPIMQEPITGQPDKEFVLLSIEWPPDSVGPRAGRLCGQRAQWAMEDIQGGRRISLARGSGPRGQEYDGQYLDHAFLRRGQGQNPDPAVHQALN